MNRPKVTMTHLYRKKQMGEKITMLSCYDAWSAKIIDQTPVDMILVGDSVAMVCHGYDHTVHADMSMMEMHTAAVARMRPRQMIVADLPFLSYRKSLSKAVSAAEALIKAGAQAVKLEGVQGNEAVIEHLVASGVPVMGHLGLTPQHIHQLGGFRVQGKTEQQAETIMADAKMLESLGCFALVLECVPAVLAQQITKDVAMFTVGIGAGAHTDGQVLVLHDLLGLGGFSAKFLKKYLAGDALVAEAITAYCADVSSCSFPAKEHSYHD